MEGHLKRRDYEVVSASNGREALKHLETAGRFAVLVTDLTMPKLGGLELLRQARELDSWIEVIVITASNDVESAISAMREDGAYDYLVKPLETIGVLSLAVERAAAHRALRMEREQLNVRLAMEASRLKALLANTGDAILAADAQGRITIANPAAELLLGGVELPGQLAMEVLPPPLAATISNWEAADQKSPAVVEVNWPEATLQVVSLTPISQEGAFSGGWVMVLRDVTHLKKLGDLKVRLLTEAARKIRLPLAHAVSTLSELSAAPGSQDDRLTNVVYRLAKLLGHIQGLMDDLMSLIRIEAGIGIHLVDLDLAALLSAETIEGSARLNVPDELQLTFDIEKSLPKVQGDPDLLRNLLSRMVERAAEGASGGNAVQLTASQRQDQVWVEVQDQSEQSSGEPVQHIPEQALSDYTFGEDGFGFDMAMIKAMADGMGGRIWVRGGPGRSTIALSLPVLPASSEQAKSS
jgi:two-component system sensor histidine kinase ResE